MRNRIAQGRATKLRKQLTDAERHLWYHLRRRGLADSRFRRQVPIGPFIADFASLEFYLVVEIDGGQHGGAVDVARDRYLRSAGFRVLRFWNHEVLQETDAVLEVIRRSVCAPPSCPSPAERGKERTL